jgi:S-adenosylmethionine hydrolase
MLNPLITFTTDFGTSDHFAATMKAVVLGIAPRARIIDITHEVTPFEVVEGAYTLAQAYRYFPAKTIHVVVVDPGVGSARRPILAAMAGQYFVAPDNGVLSLVFARETGREQVKVRHITNEKFMLHPVSRTFHGRDVFSPVAAHLAMGVPPAKFGKLIEDHLRLSLDKPTQSGKRNWTGTVLKVDRFGNLITNFHIDDFPQIEVRPFDLSIGLEKINRLALTFTECAPDEAFAIVGSSGYLEVAVNQGSAARALGCGAGSPVELVLH